MSAAPREMSSLDAFHLVLDHSKAKGTDLSVLLSIAKHIGPGGAWPSIATIARYVNVTPRTVQRSVARLAEMGELRVERQRGGPEDVRADRRPNRYVICLNGVTSTPARGSDGVTSPTPRGDNPDVHGVTPTSPEPSLEQHGPSAHRVGET